MRYTHDLRKARRAYSCGVLQPIGCSKKILVGDIYFCMTETDGEKFRTYRYCLDCAQQLYPQMVKSALANAKSDAKKRATRGKVWRTGFAERQSNYLRTRRNPAEEYLWSFLRDKQLGVTFYRQKALQGFIVDFWCPELQLVIELDGTRHLSRKEKDRARDSVLREHEIKVIRFPAGIVYSDLSVILETIRNFSTQNGRGRADGIT